MYYSATKHSIFFLVLVILSGFLNSYNFFNTFQETTINLLCLFLIMTIGISHGSLDNLKGEKLLKIYKIKNQSIFYLLYIFICLVVILIWLFLPSLMLCIFLLVASYHFGKEDSIIFHSQEFKHGIKEFHKPKYDILIFTLKGSMIVVFPLSFHFSEILEIFKILLIDNKYFIEILSNIFENNLLGIAILFTPVIANYFTVRNIDDFVFIYIELICILALNIIFTPLIAFTIYFCFLHSVRHSATLIHELDIKNFSKGFKKFVNKALPLTLITAVFFVVSIYFLTNYYVLDDAILKVIFIGLASLTFPHILLEYLLEKNEK
jgi:beta-carotene 15,15'-dioxygenase